jgi:predicted nucleic acid-binding Zn ribbon protein
MSELEKEFKRYKIATIIFFTLLGILFVANILNIIIKKYE